MLTESGLEEVAVWAFRPGDRYLAKRLECDKLITVFRVLLAYAWPNASDDDPLAIANRTAPSSDALPRTQKQGPQRTAPAIAYIAENYANQISLQAVAARCYMSPSRFSRTFTQEHGLPFRQYLVRYRIDRACESLRDPAMHVATAAYRVGFDNPAYFTRIFRHCLGITPSTFRARYQSAPAPARLPG